MAMSVNLRRFRKGKARAEAAHTPMQTASFRPHRAERRLADLEQRRAESHLAGHVRQIDSVADTGCNPTRNESPFAFRATALAMMKRPPGLPDAKAAASPLRLRKHSVVIAGHRTSISLEDAFWQALQAIAASRPYPWPGSSRKST